MLAYSIIANNFHQVNACREYSKKEYLWDSVIDSGIKTESSIIYIEFGVHEGYSLNYFCGRNTNPESVFIGLDSFEGLPEDWGGLPKGTFDTQGKIPRINDPRVSFIKGWFQNSWPQLNDKLLSTNNLANIVVHYDADLYSSTLFALTKIDNLKKSYIAIFDEFTGHETRALYNYIQAYGADGEFYGKTNNAGCAGQVVCRITPIDAT